MTRYEKVRRPTREGTRTDEEGSLFDMTFSKFVTPRLIRWLYGLLIALAAIVGVVQVIAIGAVGAVGEDPAMLALFVLVMLLAIVTFMAVVLIGRIFCEFVLVLFRIEEHSQEIREVVRKWSSQEFPRREDAQVPAPTVRHNQRSLQTSREAIQTFGEQRWENKLHPSTEEKSLPSDPASSMPAKAIGEQRVDKTEAIPANRELLAPAEHVDAKVAKEISEQPSLFPARLEAVGVSLETASPLTLRCMKCTKLWYPEPDGGRLGPAYWQCPEGCNTSK